MESPCGYVEVELADGEAEAADPEVAEAEDPAAVGHCVDGRERVTHLGPRDTYNHKNGKLESFFPTISEGCNHATSV